MKKIILFCFVFNFLPSSTRACNDCRLPLLYSKYVRFEVIAHIKLIKEYSKYKFGFKLIKNFKEAPLDTLCGKFRLGDEIIIYGYNNVQRKTTFSHPCNGNRLVSRMETKGSPYSNSLKIQAQLEIKALKFYKRKFGILHLNEPPYFKYKNREVPNFFHKYDIKNFLFYSKKVKIAYIEIILDKNGRILNVNFMNKIPDKLKQEFLENLQKGHFKISDVKEFQQQKYRIIKNIVYPISNYNTRDF